MSLIKSQDDIAKLRVAGKRLSFVLGEVAKAVKPGVTTEDLDEIAHRLIIEGGDKAILKNYRPQGARIPFPASICISVNEEVVHGIPGRRVLEEGDIVGLDLCLDHEGVIVDMAMTVPVGKISKEDEKLVEVTKKSLSRAISAVRAGNTIGDIGYEIENYVTPFGYGIVEALGGHGVGHAIHEPPYIANFGKKKTGQKLEAGMVLALEPMLNAGTYEVYLSNDGYTFITNDGKKSAHFEVTILVTENGSEILTPQPKL